MPGHPGIWVHQYTCSLPQSQLSMLIALCLQPCHMQARDNCRRSPAAVAPCAADPCATLPIECPHLLKEHLADIHEGVQVEWDDLDLEMPTSQQGFPARDVSR